MVMTYLHECADAKSLRDSADRRVMSAIVGKGQEGISLSAIIITQVEWRSDNAVWMSQVTGRGILHIAIN